MPLSQSLFLPNGERKEGRKEGEEGEEGKGRKGRERRKEGRAGKGKEKGKKRKEKGKKKERHEEKDKRGHFRRVYATRAQKKARNTKKKELYVWVFKKKNN